MSFIRIKRISGKEYAYLVENKWYKRKFKSKGKGPRQSVSKYLGRVFGFSRHIETGFFEFQNIQSVEQYLSENRQDQVIKDLVLWEVFRNGIDSNEFLIDFKGKKVRKNGKDVVLRINEGFLCSYTLRRLFLLNSENSYYLAKCFIEAGIEIPQDLFVGLFVE